MFPLRLAKLLRTLARDVRQVSAVDIVLALAEALPTGLYSGEGIERYVRRILSDPDRTDDFRELSSELYLVATDLDTCERVVFGSDGWDDVPISRAVSASSALPMIYKPVKIGDRENVDGGIVSTTNLDIAVEAGAKLIVVVNPLVPYVNDFETRIPTLTGSRPRRVSDMGFPHIGYQAFKLLAHQRLHELARRWEERYPGVDIILIEPDTSDELMFQTSIMNFTSRVDIARHGFQSVTLKLANDYPRFKRICARHGIEISATRVRKVSSTSRPSASPPAPGARSWSRRRRRCYVNPPSSAPSGPALSHAYGPSPDEKRSYALATCACGCADTTVISRRLERNRVLSIRPLKIGTPNSHAFDDDVAPVQPGFTCQLGGRQVIGHRSSPFAVHYMTTSMQRHPDADNPAGRKYVCWVHEFPPHLGWFMKFYFRAAWKEPRTRRLNERGSSFNSPKEGFPSVLE